MTNFAEHNWQTPSNVLTCIFSEAFTWADNLLITDDCRRKLWECPDESFYNATEILHLFRSIASRQPRKTASGRENSSPMKYCACYAHFEKPSVLRGLLDQTFTVQFGKNSYDIELHIYIISKHLSPIELFEIKSLSGSGWSVFAKLIKFSTSSDLALCFLGKRNDQGCIIQNESVIFSQFETQKELVNILLNREKETTSRAVASSRPLLFPKQETADGGNITNSKIESHNYQFSDAKIGFYVSSFEVFGGLEQWVVNMVRALQEIGLQCVVMVLGDAGPGVHFPKSLLSMTHFLDGDSTRLSSIAVKENVDTLITNHVYAGIRELHPELAVIEVIHNIYFWQLNDFAIQQSRKRAVYIVCVSQSTFEYTKDFLEVPERKLVIIEHGIDLEGFIRPLVFKERQNSAKREFRVLSVANQYPQKNGLLLIKAFCEEFSTDSSTYLDIAGATSHGEIATAMREYAFRSPCADRVVFHGSLDRRRLSKLYSESSVFCLPSLYEGFGLSSLEAMHFGIPVILSNTGHASKLVRSSDGILVDIALPFDVLTEASALETSLHPGAESVRILRQAFRTVKTDYTSFKHAAQKLAYSGKIKTVSTVAVEYANLIISVRRNRRNTR